MKKSKAKSVRHRRHQLSFTGVVALASLVSSQASATLLVTSDQTVSTDLSETGLYNPGFIVSSPATLTVANGGIIGWTNSGIDANSTSKVLAGATLNVLGGGTVLGETEVTGKMRAGMGEATRAILNSTASAIGIISSYAPGAETVELDNVLLEGSQLYPGSGTAIDLNESSLNTTARTEIISSGAGVRLRSISLATLSINGSKITAGESAIYLIGAGSDSFTDAVAVVTNATLKGDRNGAQVLGHAEYFMHGGSVLGAGIIGYGAGMVLLDGSTLVADQSALIEGRGALSGAVLISIRNTGNVGGGPVSLTLSDGTIARGAGNGILWNGDLPVLPTAVTSSAVIDDASVSGQTGAAVRVEGALHTLNLDVKNNAHLTGGNGTILETDTGANAIMSVSNASLEGNLDNSNGTTMNVFLNDNAAITGTASKVSEMDISPTGTFAMTGSSDIDTLKMMQGATVKLSSAPGANNVLTVANLSGNGNFQMNADFDTGKADLLKVTGTADGSHILFIPGRGTDPQVMNLIPVVTTAGNGSADFTLNGKSVDVGVYTYQLVRAENVWNLVPTAPVNPINPVNPVNPVNPIQPIQPNRPVQPIPNAILSNSSKTILGLTNSTPTIWFGENTVLVQRMGELRGGQVKSNDVWGITFGSRNNIASSVGVDYQHKIFGFVVGADRRIPVGGGTWYLGGMMGYSRSNLSFSGNSNGTVDSYSVGGYATWLGNSAFYIDTIVKLNEFSNKADAWMNGGGRSKGSFHNWGGGVSVELGKKIPLFAKAYAEPYVQVAAFRRNGDSFSLDNGMNADQDAAGSIRGQIGTRLGISYALKNEGAYISPYLKLAMIGEVASRNKTRLNRTDLDDDMNGTRGLVGGGIIVQARNNLQFHVDVDYVKGHRVEQPIGVNLGLRYMW